MVSGMEKLRVRVIGNCSQASLVDEFSLSVIVSQKNMSTIDLNRADKSLFGRFNETYVPSA